MNVLALAQLTHRMIGLGSRGNTAKPGTVPTALTGQTDELEELVYWVLQALTNFQTMYKWGWLIQQGTLPFLSGDSTVVPTASLTNYRDWIPFKQGGRRYVLRYLNVIANGSFYSAPVAATDWPTVAPANWAYSSGASGAAAATASSTALTHAYAATAGERYEVSYTVTRTSGAITPSIGGVSGTTRSVSGSYTEVITATGTGVLTFTPAAFTGTLSGVSVHPLAHTSLPVYFMEYADFRGLRDRSPVATGAPMYFTIHPSQLWEVYPTPDANYTLKLDYLCAPKIYTTSDGTTKIEDYPGAANSAAGLPVEFHEAIAWLAIRYWAESRGKLDTFQIAERRFDELTRPLKARYLPTARI